MAKVLVGGREVNKLEHQPSFKIDRIGNARNLFNAKQWFWLYQCFSSTRMGPYKITREGWYSIKQWN